MPAPERVPEHAPVPAPERVPEPVPEPAPERVPEPIPEPIPEPAQMPSKPRAIWIFADEKHVEQPAVAPEQQPEPQPEPQPETMRRKRSFDSMSDEDEVKAIGPISRVLSPPVSPVRANANAFDSFQRQTMDFDAVSNIVAPKKVPKLPPVIVMTRAEAEQKIRGLEARFKVGLSRQEILSMRSSVATCRGDIKKLKMQIAEKESQAMVAEELEEVFQYCDTLRQLAASRAVKRAVIASFGAIEA